jgi:hypothetical protein
MRTLMLWARTKCKGKGEAIKDLSECAKPHLEDRKSLLCSSEIISLNWLTIAGFVELVPFCRF